MAEPNASYNVHLLDTNDPMEALRDLERQINTQNQRIAEALSEGFIFGALELEDNTVETEITTAGVKVQISNFVASTLEIVGNGTNPDFSEGHIEIESDGSYIVGCTLSVERSGGALFTAHFECFKNNGATHLAGVHASQYFPATATAPTHVTMIGIANLVKGDTVEIWVTNETNTVNLLVSEIALTVVKVSNEAE
jgi:hypothetical protein